MGVTGLWRLIEPAGKPVPVETLENKVLAVDISIWLHQIVKGYQDAKGAPLPNAHLIGLFQRLCKLLYFRIKPVFVFDGAFPALKRETITKRQHNKQKYNSESERIKRELAILLTKKTAIGSLLGTQVSPPKKVSRPQTDEDLFKLPALPAIPQHEDEESSDDEASSSNSSIVDLHSIDLESPKFKELPSKEKYDLLLELKETRKMNSWGKLHELPKKSDNFSDFQMQRLLKRRKVQECLEETEKEMGDTGMSLNDLESLLNEEGIDTKIETLTTRRIASNNSTRYLLINDVKQALADAKKKKEADQASTSNADNVEGNETKKDELEEDLEKAIKMSLECDKDAGTSKTDDSWTSYMSDSEAELSHSDSEEEDGCEAPDLTSAKAYIMQYCDFTNKAIDDIVSRNKSAQSKNKKSKLDAFTKSQIINDGAYLSFSDDECNHTTDSDVEAHTRRSKEDSIAKTIDLNEASVVVLDDQNDEVIILDSTTEESPVDNIENQEESSDNSAEDVPQTEQPVATKRLKIADKNMTVESDSSDNDFEDVPDIESKPVVQLTFNMNAAPEDDIFADIFADHKAAIESKMLIENQQTAVEISNEEDDELQKAIMMSLECVTDDNISVHNDSAQIADKARQIVKDVIDEPNTDSRQLIKEKPKTTKTLESLNQVLSAQSSKINESKEKYTNKTPEAKDKTPLSNEQLNNMVEEIQNKEQNLEQEKGRLDRIGRNITEQMTKEAQELLQMFGIPYIVAPMEAEAQCAFLESVNLTDGTITDDSDIWLFGGKTVYKNFFNQKKHVLQFLGERIEKSFNLSREQLILLALLVGSDYTTGIDGVGPVTALEILASFPFNKHKLNETSEQARYTEMIMGLQKFKQWVRSGKRTDNTSLKKKLRNISLNDDFPSVRVVQAYLEPNIEKSEEKFSWGELDITILRDYTKSKFGWSQNKLDEIIKPVLKRILERKSQKSVKDYFKTKTSVQSLEDQMSKRVKAAVQRIGPEISIAHEEDVESDTKTAAKRKSNKKTIESVAGPSKSKKKKSDESVLKNLNVRIVSEEKEGKSEIDIKINKTDRYQEIIPQREKDKQSLLQNKMKAIELFRKTNIDKKKKIRKRKAILPKEKAELSESSDSN